jgi:hypothetical protein
MANVYVWSAATGAGTGADWANAYTSLVTAAAAKLAGDVFFVAHDHVETAAVAKNINFTGTETNPNRCYCVDRAGSVPPVAADLRTTAQILTTGANAISFGGTCSEFNGFIVSAGDGASNAGINVGANGNRSWRVVNCAFKLNNTSGTPRITFASGSASNNCIVENCTCQFGAVGQAINSGGRTFWRNTPNAIVGSFIPTFLLVFNGAAVWHLEGVDLSAVGSGKTLFNGQANSPNQLGVLKNCKLGTGVTITNTPPTYGGCELQVINSDSADTNYRQEKYNFVGTETTETTIVRTGGATDGGTPISKKIVTTANAKPEWQFDCLPIYVWNETIGTPITLTIEGIWGGGAVPTNADIWVDIEYLGTSGFPLASKAGNGRASGLAVPANLSAGSGTWGGSTTKFSMSGTFTPQEKGLITVYVRAGLASSTFYIDPKPVIT